MTKRSPGHVKSGPRTILSGVRAVQRVIPGGPGQSIKSPMKLPFNGGCECGAIRYKCTAEPIMMLKCHCRDCQKVTGSGFAPAILVAREAFRITRGQLRYHFTSSAAGGKHKRGFCPECGS